MEEVSLMSSLAEETILIKYKYLILENISTKDSLLVELWFQDYLCCNKNIGGVQKLPLVLEYLVEYKWLSEEVAGGSSSCQSS